MGDFMDFLNGLEIGVMCALAILFGIYVAAKRKRNRKSSIDACATAKNEGQLHYVKGQISILVRGQPYVRKITFSKWNAAFNYFWLSCSYED
ncbi:hypothetical protein Back11_19340 [Paenibacillus baekrokdamisoli]|uniref:Uncharacterized protein n=1 Tax=Paenibacillus baekrokdamisoli TaxID=1712516 RepID=A0A3G9JCB2_9BACL|nr:hypothetical protein [Paenibacillus baekrokdamisoli]MBB3070063.1 hypothetical protein [Paenibacillus baekrokdamisoli]BBH20589.1 hypothetical protein Back11_19340 [Paenibacillus baekrokdamisoli]